VGLIEDLRYLEQDWELWESYFLGYFPSRERRRYLCVLHCKEPRFRQVDLEKEMNRKY